MKKFHAFFFLLISITTGPILWATQCPTRPIAPLKIEFSVNEPLLVMAGSPVIARDAMRYHWLLVGKTGKSIRLKTELVGENHSFFRLETPNLHAGDIYTLRADRSELCRQHRGHSCNYPLMDPLQLKISAQSAVLSSSRIRSSIEKVFIRKGPLDTSGILMKLDDGKDFSGYPFGIQIEREASGKDHETITSMLFYGKSKDGHPNQFVIGGTDCLDNLDLDFGQHYKIRLYQITASGAELTGSWSVIIPPPPGLSETDMAIIQEFRRVSGSNPGTAEWSHMTEIQNDRVFWERYRKSVAKTVEFSAQQLNVHNSTLDQ